MDRRELVKPVGCITEFGLRHATFTGVCECGKL